MNRREKKRAARVVEEDDERLACAALAQLREGWGKHRRRARAWMDGHLLEACALGDNEQMAWRPAGPSLMDILAAETLESALSPRPEALPMADALRLPGDTRKALALWARYSLARLELLGGGRVGDA